MREEVRAAAATAYEHAWEIRTRYGYRPFEDAEVAGRFGRFLAGRAWTHAEGPVALFDQSVAWLRRNRALLPGVSVLARQVSAARETAETRLHTELAGAAHRVDPGLPARLAALLQVPEGARLSELERLRRSPRRSSGPGMVKALQRAEQIAALGAGRVDVEDIPANRMQVLARSGLGSKASALARLARRRVAQEPLAPTEIDAELVTAAWRRAVYANPDLPDGAVDRDEGW